VDWGFKYMSEMEDMIRKIEKTSNVSVNVKPFSFMGIIALGQ
jgi:hypothetical protein